MSGLVWSAEELTAVVARLRDTAANPVKNTLPPLYVEGVSDGMRISASVLEVLIDIKTREEAK